MIVLGFILLIIGLGRREYEKEPTYRGQDEVGIALALLGICIILLA